VIQSQQVGVAIAASPAPGALPRTGGLFIAPISERRPSAFELDAPNFVEVTLTHVASEVKGMSR